MLHKIDESESDRRFGCRVNRFDERGFPQRFDQIGYGSCRCTLRSGTGFIVRGDNDRRDFDSGAGQINLKLETVHFRHLQIED